MRSCRFRGHANLALLALCLLPVPLLAEKGPPTFDGYVTNIVSPSEFDVGKRHVICDDNTTWQRNSTLPEFLTELRVGIAVHVDGEFRDLNHKRTFVATNVHPNPNEINLANFLRDLNQRASRIGLSYMLAAGYDIREAPFAWTIAANHEEHNPMKTGVPAPTMASTLMESLQLDYAATDYSALKTSRHDFAAMQAKLRAADDKLPKPKNQGD
ncbi:MAG TPA: hypothetical protein VGD64_08450 [Acidisarcina sp.]